MATREQLEQQLEQADSALEPGVLSLLSRFMKAGGNPLQSVNLLSSSYRGLPDMCNLVAEWMAVVDPDRGRDQAAGVIDRHLHALAIQHFDPARADSIFSSVCAALSVCSCAKAPGAGPKGASPDWIQGFVGFPSHRQLIYELANVHQQCLFLLFAIRKISEAGHQRELVGIAPVTKFASVYSRVLVCAILNLQAEDESTFRDQMQKLIVLGHFGCRVTLH